MGSYHAKKRLGQNFLKHPDSLNRLVDTALALPGGPIIEVGPGRGALTLPLAKAGRTVVAVEFDQDLIGYLIALLRDYPSVSLVHSDFLAFDPAQHGLEHFSLVGNLPYNITSPVLDWVTRYRRCIDAAVLMMQREVAYRVTATPGSRAWAPLTIMTRLHFEPELLWEIPPEHFSPKPAVHSAIVRLYPKERTLASPLDLFETVARVSFVQRRKLLSANLANGFKLPAETIHDLLESMGLSPTVRAEELSIEQFDLLALALRARLPRLSGREAND